MKVLGESISPAINRGHCTSTINTGCIAIVYNIHIYKLMNQQ